MRSSFYAERVAQGMTALPPKADIELVLVLTTANDPKQTLKFVS